MNGRTRLPALADDRDRGSAEPVALAIMAPVMLLLIGMLATGGMVAIADQSISGVAGDAARDASMARTATEAIAIANSSATAALAAQNLHCKQPPNIVVNASGFAAAPGSLPAPTVTVDITCVVLISDLAMKGLPGSRSLHDRAVSAIDPFRTKS